MALLSSPRVWFDAVSWHVRGVFASDANRRIGFRARELWQPAEIEARRGMARDLAAELPRELRVDREQGYLVLPPTAVPPVDEVCAIGRSIISAATLDDGVANSAKKFSRIRVASFEQRLSLVRFGVDRRMLAMAAAYLGVMPVITEADYFCSFPIDGPYTKSQLWHCDDDAGDVFKVFLYCDDVTEHDGPFELIGPEPSRRTRAAIGYRYAGRRYRVSDAVMEQHVTSSQLTTMIAPRGSAFAVDTVRCFHRGSRIVDPTRRRVVGTICYCPPSARTAPRRLAARTAPLLEFASQFEDRLARAALGVPVATRWL